MEENNKKENITSKISETIQKTIDIVVEKLKKVEDVDSKKAEEMNKNLESIYNRIKAGNLNAFEILQELMMIQNNLIIFLDSDEYKQKNVVVQMNESSKEKEEKALQIYSQTNLNIFEKLKQLIAKFFRKLAKEGVME